MRLVLVGAVAFSEHCLRSLHRHGAELVEVFAQDVERNRFNADAADLAATAEELGYPVTKFRRLNADKYVERLRELEPDVILILGLSQLVSDDILAIPKLGCVGSHPSPLPVGRGRHPIIWSIALGLTESALSFLWLAEGADTGDLLWQRAFPIAEADTSATVYDRVAALADEAIAEFLPWLRSGDPPRIPQDDSVATQWRKRGEADGLINWAGSSKTAWDLIRALTKPYLGAHTFCDEQRLIIWRAESYTLGAQSRPAGAIFDIDESSFCVATADGFVTLHPSAVEAPNSAAPFAPTTGAAFHGDPDPETP